MKKILPITLIFLFALLLRTVNLGDHPPGLTWDEAALGYNAYSIMKTGRDEFGAFLPIIFKSFGDYKPGVYVYLTVPSVAIFGLNEFAVRFPSALFGALAVIGIYLLTNLLFPKKSLGIRNSTFDIGHAAAAALALMPWHLHFSRGGWEVNVFVTEIIFATYFLLLSLTSRRVSFIVPLSLFVLSIFTYQAGKLLAPLIIFMVLALNWTEAREKFAEIKKKKFHLSISIILLCVAFIYFVQTAIGPAGNRVARLSIFGYRPTPSAELIRTDNSNSISVATFHSQIDLTLRAITSRYLYHFSPELLFFENNAPREALPKMGLLYLFDAILLIFGAIFLLRHEDRRPVIILLGLLLFAPLGASLTLSEFSVVRALLMTVPLAIVSALGFYYLWRHHRIVFVILCLLYTHNIFLNLDLYFKHSRDFLAPSFNYGYKQAIERIKTYPAKNVVMTDSYGQPYIYYLFYTRYDPATYQRNNNFISGGVDVGSVPSVGNVSFQQFGGTETSTQKDTLFIGTNVNIPDNFNYQQENVEFFDQINLPDETTPVFRIIKTKP